MRPECTRLIPNRRIYNKIKIRSVWSRELSNLYLGYCKGQDGGVLRKIRIKQTRKRGRVNEQASTELGGKLRQNKYLYNFVKCANWTLNYCVCVGMRFACYGLFKFLSMYMQLQYIYNVLTCHYNSYHLLLFENVTLRIHITITSSRVTLWIIRDLTA